MKAGGRKEAIRKFIVSVGVFIPSVILIVHDTRKGQQGICRQGFWGHPASGDVKDSRPWLDLTFLLKDSGPSRREKMMPSHK